jgi:hypothetical protein
MRPIALCLAMASLLAIGACSDSATDRETTGSTEIDANPSIDRDPTPDTGTGGEQQGSPPEAAKPAN